MRWKASELLYKAYLHNYLSKAENHIVRHAIVIGEDSCIYKILIKPLFLWKCLNMMVLEL
jgi:hypothetical protein